MANKTMYQITGRYMSGAETTGYHLVSNNSNKSARFTKDQMAFLVGRGQVTNCSGQLYDGKVLFRGIGISIEDLPIQRDSGEIVNTENVGKIHRGATGGDIMSQVSITHAIVNGKYTIGYIMVNGGGGTMKISRDKALQLAKEKKIGNARYQESNGKPILRGVNINLNELPTISAESIGITTKDTPKTEQTPKVAAQPTEKSVKSAQKVTEQTLNNSQKLLESKLSEQEQTKLKKFRAVCANTFNAINKSIDNKLIEQGFSGIQGDPTNIEDMVVLERFDYGIKGKDGSYGGFIELVKARGVGVKFSYCVGDDDPQTQAFGLTAEGFKQGWSWCIHNLRVNRAI